MMKILVVEDDALIAMIAMEILCADGHEVVGPAYSDSEALTIAQDTHIDLAFIDINLAGGDEGIALARTLRESFGIAAVFTSGQIAVAREHRDAAMGLLPKPYSLDDLRSSAAFTGALISRARVLPPKPLALELFAIQVED